MDTERPHRSTSSSNSSSTSELFVCFTSRLSSSSMKLSSKSLLSPSRSSRDPPQISLSSSLSRRLRSNGSMKGGQASPMFPTVGKRRGCGFENPEPSSPKVTCIGQVRVKTKKQGKKIRARSKRRSEASFRKTTTDGGVNSSDLTRQNSSSAFQYQNNHQNLQQECLKHRNQRWVHLPLTICEALREFNCFFPCRSSCMREKGEKGGAFGEEGSNGGGHGHHHDGREGSCGAAFARWLHVALQEGGDGKGREIEVVMREDEVEVEDDGGDGDGDDGRQTINAGRSYRRHVFEDIDIDVVEGKKEKEKEKEGEGGEAEKARVSICVPPKNALLLMRCRSDPVKMAALANRFWESPVQKDQHGVNVEDDEEDEEHEGHGGDDGVEEHQEDEVEEEQKEVEMEEDEGVRKNTEEARNSICEREREGSVESEEQHHHVVPFPEEAEQAEEEPEVMEGSEIESRTNPDSSEVHEANQAKEEQEKDEDEEGNASHQQDENFSCASNLETHSDLGKPETTLEAHLQEENNNQEEEDKNDESSELSSTPETLNASEPQNDEAEAAQPQPQPEQQPKTATIAETETSTQEEDEEEGSSTEEQQQQKQQNVTTDTPPPPPPPEVTPPTQEEPDPNNEPGSEERENGSNGDQRERERDQETLPECLLLMMCEPKLSMEVSKETWVCSTDFIRWLPERPAGKSGGGGGRRVSTMEGKNGVEKKASPAAAAPPVQPPRSSCSFPAAAGVSMAAMIEQRLAAGTKSNGYEPFVLTRCKSEPMRSTAKLAADSCFWKKPHAPPATLGVGAPAGVGF